MSPAWGFVAGVITATLMLFFAGVWVWAWLPRHRRSFDALARIPMEDQRAAAPPAHERP